jgi:hypothetical protein
VEGRRGEVGRFRLSFGRRKGGGLDEGWTKGWKLNLWNPFWEDGIFKRREGR